MINLSDSVELSDSSERTYTPEGYLIAPAIVARTGIQFYLGRELGDATYITENNLDKNKTYAIYRPDEEVFKPSYLDSIKRIPVVNNDAIHQSGKEDSSVTSENWKKNAVGEVLDANKHNNRFIKSQIIVRDSKAIKDVESGKNQVSLGYTSELEWSAGVDKSGNKYDAKQKNMTANHLAIVNNARAGSVARIADSENNNNKEDNKMTTRMVLVDGFSVETTDAGAVAIEKLIKDRDAAIKLSDSNLQKANDAQKLADEMDAKAKKSDKDLEDKDKELTDAKADNEKLKKEAVSADEMDKKVADRADVVAKGKKMADSVDYKGLSNHDYRKAVIKSVISADSAVKPLCDAITAGKEIDTIDENTSLAAFNVLHVAKSSSDKKSNKTALGDALIGDGKTQEKEKTPQQKAKEALENAWNKKSA